MYYLNVVDLLYDGHERGKKLGGGWDRTSNMGG